MGKVVKTEEKTLVEWSTPERPFKKRGREFYVTLISIVALFAAILFIIEGIMPVIFLVSLLFLFYVLSTVPPRMVDCRITNKGILFATKFTEWSGFGRFWFTNRWGTDLLVLETHSIPGRLEIVVNESLKPTILEALNKYLTHEEIPASSIDKLISWASKKLPQK